MPALRTLTVQTSTSTPAIVRAARTMRTVWLVLWLWTAAWGVVAAIGGGYSWHYFADGARLLLQPGSPGAGLSLYAAHPELQIGPLALVVAIPFQQLGGTGRLLAELVLTAAGPGLIWVLARARRELLGRGPTPAELLVVGVLALPVWCQVATHYAHLDDVLALALAALAVLALTSGRPYAAALALGLSIDSKPWAAGFAVLLVALPRRARRRALLLLGAVIAVAWLPFVIAAPQTLAMSRFTIDNVGSSALRALGVVTSGTPGWDRPAQLALGVGVGLVCVLRGRWPAAILAVVVARLLLDPQTYPYYSSGLLVAAVVADVVSTRRGLPAWTAAAAGWVVLDAASPTFVAAAQVGTLRAAYCLGVLALLVALPHSGTPWPRGLSAALQRSAATIVG